VQSGLIINGNFTLQTQNGSRPTHQADDEETSSLRERQHLLSSAIQIARSADWIKRQAIWRLVDECGTLFSLTLAM
jgi:hypothetical protein